MDMKGQPQLELGAVVSFTVSGLWEPHNGWHVMVNTRREFENWGNAVADFYDELTTNEMLDMVSIALCQRVVSQRP